jgi:hypothetical protein
MILLKQITKTFILGLSQLIFYITSAAPLKTCLSILYLYQYYSQYLKLLSAVSNYIHCLFPFFFILVFIFHLFHSHSLCNTFFPYLYPTDPQLFTCLVSLARSLLGSSFIYLIIMPVGAAAVSVVPSLPRIAGEVGPPCELKLLPSVSCQVYKPKIQGGSTLAERTGAG